jgi:dolichyl-phosphate-mannose-protein mannosyltransferase
VNRASRQPGARPLPAPPRAPGPPAAPSDILDRWGPPALIALAAAVFIAIHLYGIASPFYYGHYGFHGGEHATWARGTLRFHTIYPVNVPGWAPPLARNYYIHHPVLPPQLTVLAFLLLGEHEYSIRIFAMLAPLVSLGLVAALVWRWFGRFQAGFAAVTFAIVPINVWYGSHMDHGFPSIAFLLGFLWFYLDWIETGRWRAATLALVLQALAGFCEWSPYVAFPLLFAHALWLALRRRGRFVTFAALQPLAVVVPLGVHVALVWRAGLWADWVTAYHTRTASIPFGAFVRRMGEYGGTLYGSVLIVATAAWAVLTLARLATGRARARDLIGGTFLFALVVYAQTFHDAIVTHAYRQLYGNVAATLAATELVDTFVALVAARVAAQARPRVIVRAAAVVAAAILFVPTARLARAGMLESRAHGGIPGWTVFNPELDKAVLARHVHDVTRPGDTVYFHGSYPYPPPHRKDCAFYYDKDLRERFPLAEVERLTPAQRARGVLVLAPGALGPAEVAVYARLALQHPVFRVGAWAMVDLREAQARYELVRMMPPAPEGRGAFRAYLDGPYPWPQLVPDPQAAQAERVALEAMAGGAAGGAPPPSAVPAPVAGPSPAMAPARAVLERDAPSRRLSGPGER